MELRLFELRRFARRHPECQAALPNPNRLFSRTQPLVPRRRFPGPSHQLATTKELAPSNSRSAIAGVFLPSADVDPAIGLLHLREFQHFFVFCTAGVQRALRGENRIFRVLERSDPPVQWQTLSSKGRLGCHLSESPGEAPAFVCSTTPLGGCYPDFVSQELLRALSGD